MWVHHMGLRMAVGWLDRQDAATARYKAKQRAARNDIGPIDPCRNPERRESCRLDFALFCKTYFSQVFTLPWSPNHHQAAERIETAILRGGLFAFAMPRGSGKSSLCESAVIWAICYSHKPYVALVGATEQKSEDALKSIQVEFANNELLRADFPEITQPIHELGTSWRLTEYQTSNGRPTAMVWKTKKVVLPTVADQNGVLYPTSGSIIQVCGITGDIRGLKHKRQDGSVIRPSLVICDDPQTRDALDIDTPIPTPTGFVRIGDLEPGDIVFDEHGQPCNVLGVSEFYENRPCYRVYFDDGVSVVADAGHLWSTSTQRQRTNARRKREVLAATYHHHKLHQCRPKPYESLRTTEEILDTLHSDGDRNNHSIRITGAVEMPEADLPVPPYTFGVWLGDGDTSSNRVTTADPEILDQIVLDGFKIGKRVGKPDNRAASYSVSGLRRLLVRNGFLGRKYIPERYLFASRQQRLSLLQGLMDTDGWVTKPELGVKGGRCAFFNTNRNIIDGVMHLCRSLGIKARCNPVRPQKSHHLPAWVVSFITDEPVFRLPRKAERQPFHTKPNTKRRYITAVEPVPTRPVRCITVDSPSHLYLCGEGFVPTHNSAKSPTQSESRAQTIAADVAYLAGPGEPIAVLVPCTVIYADDMADRILNRELHPEYQGIRTKMVDEFPSDMTLWDEYGRILKDSLRNDGDMTPATEFYRQNRAAMDSGFVVTWPERHRPDELSAVQHAMNLMIRDPTAFWSECQNEPVESQGESEIVATRAEVLAKITDYERFQCPKDTTVLTSFIDVQHNSLFYLLAGWQPGFVGQIIDYGTWPPQDRRDFNKTNLGAQFENVLPGMTVEQQIYNALKALVAHLCGHAFPVDGGGQERVSRVLIDASEGRHTNTVYQFCRECQWGTVVMPSHGRYVGAASQPWAQWTRKKGETVGLHWRIRPSTEWPIKHAIFDSNYWKTFVHGLVKAPFGGSGTIGIYGKNTNSRILETSHHSALADHLCLSEFPVRVESKDKVVYEWKEKSNRPPNEFLDCLVGAAVAGSMQGIELEASKTPRKKMPVPKVSFKESYLRNVPKS